MMHSRTIQTVCCSRLKIWEKRTTMHTRFGLGVCLWPILSFNPMMIRVVVGMVLGQIQNQRRPAQRLLNQKFAHNMTKDIISLAKQAGFQFRDAGYSPVLHLVPLEYSQKCFERFATLLRSKDSESFGSIVKYRNSFDFSPWPGVPYLNNAQDCWAVYTKTQPQRIGRMSQHKTSKYQIPGLIKDLVDHGLETDKPSQTALSGADSASVDALAAQPSFAVWTADYVRDNIHKLKETAQPAEPVAWEIKAEKFANGKQLQYEYPSNLPKYISARPLCRDCADFGPICPLDGKPCDPDANHQHIQPTCC